MVFRRRPFALASDAPRVAGAGAAAAGGVVPADTAGARGGDDAFTADALSYVDSLYGEATVTVKDGQLEMKHGDWTAPLQFWNATNFKWLLPGGNPAGQFFIKFEVSPDNTVTGLYYGLPGDLSLLSRKVARGGRGGGRGGPP